MALALRLRNATFGSGSYNRAEVTWWNAGQVDVGSAVAITSASPSLPCQSCSSAYPRLIRRTSRVSSTPGRNGLKNRRVNDQIAVVGGLKMSA